MVEWLGIIWRWIKTSLMNRAALPSDTSDAGLFSYLTSWLSLCINMTGWNTSQQFKLRDAIISQLYKAETCVNYRA